MVGALQASDFQFTFTQVVGRIAIQPYKRGVDTMSEETTTLVVRQQSFGSQIRSKDAIRNLLMELQILGTHCSEWALGTLLSVGGSRASSILDAESQAARSMAAVTVHHCCYRMSVPCRFY